MRYLIRFLSKNDFVFIALIMLIAAFWLFNGDRVFAEPAEGDDTEVAAAYVTLDVSEGSIIISESGYRIGTAAIETPFIGYYEITGDSRLSYGIEILSGEHTLLFNDVSIDQRSLESCYPLRVDEDAVLNLNLKGDNVLYAGSGHSGITLREGAQLNMNAFGNGTLSVLSYPEKRNDVLLGQKAIEVFDDSVVRYPLGKTDDLIQLYCGMNRKDAERVSVFSGQQFLRIDYNVEHCDHVLTKEADCTHDQICIQCGEVISFEKPHTPDEEATCTKPQVCTVCKTVVKEALGHQGVWKVEDYVNRGKVRQESMTCKLCAKVLHRNRNVGE